jgi:hypothetical protein
MKEGGILKRSLGMVFLLTIPIPINANRDEAATQSSVKNA